MDHNIEFETDTAYTKPKVSKQSKLVTFLIQSKLAKNEKQANVLLVIVALLFLLGSAVLFVNNGQEEYIEIEQPDPNDLLGM